MARPLGFDPDSALAAITSVFRQLGYEGTSLQDLEAATGLKKQSLYRQFGGKRAMYLAALERYEREDITAGGALIMEAGAARERFSRLFEQVIANAVENNDRRGCFLCDATVDQSQLDPETHHNVAAMMERLRAAFAQALRDSGDFDNDAEAVDRIAAHLLAAYFGVRIMIKADMGEPILRSAAEQVLAVLPD